MKNDLKTQFDGCEYWGTYQGWDIYKCYKKEVPTAFGKVFVKDGIMYHQGNIVGQVDGAGHVESWHVDEPTKLKKKEKPVYSAGVSFDAEHQKKGAAPPVEGSKSAEELLAKVFSRTIEELVGVKLADYKE